MRLVVVGGDAAGMTAASYVNRACDDADVVVLERGPYTSYSMCGIPYYIGGEIDEAADLVVRGPAAHREAGIDVRTGVEAVTVDAARRTVGWRDLTSGETGEESYDALLLATGAHPRTPELPGLARYTQVVHTLDEGEALRRTLDTASDIHRVVVVGAGYIGMELAEALVRRGLDATLLDRGTQVMGTLDAGIADVVEDRLAGFGVEVRLGEDLVEVRPGDREARLEVLTDTGAHPADTVVLALGAEPNTGLGLAAGCDVGPSGGLVVDGRMRTTVPGIWAAGDCVESRHLVSGRPVNVQLGTHANKQGKVAGIDIAASPSDGDAVFPGVVGTAVTRICDWEIGRTGLTGQEAAEAGLDAAATTFVGSAKAGYLPDAGEVHVLMRAEQRTGRILGAQLVGTGNVAKRIDVAAVWCQSRTTVQEAQFLDLSYAPPFGGVWDLLQVAARRLTRDMGLSPQL
jgi:NADPH-dependent 2,4-dienoyl-CoA reductase/sulfur reductase-like enzyme